MSTPTTALSPAELQKAARDHLWLHFTRMGGLKETDVPVIVRGDGCYLEDANGKRYLDALAGLFAVQIGYSYGDEVGEAAAAQMRELPFYTNWSYAHPRAIELAAELAKLAPGDLNRSFFVSGGSEAVESAWKLARQYATARGERRWKAIVAPRRLPRDDHGRALDQRRRRAAHAVRAARPRGASRPQHEPLPPSRGRDRGGVHGDAPRGARGDDRPGRRRTRSRCSSWSRCRTPAARSLRRPATSRACGRSATSTGSCSAPTRSSAASAGSATGSGRRKYDIRPDLITCAKGLSSAYASIGAVMTTDAVMEPFLVRDGHVLARDHVRRPSGADGDRAQEPRDHEARADRRARRRRGGCVRGDARPAPRPADRRRRPRGRVLLRDRAREGQGHARDVHGRRVRGPDPRVPLRGGSSSAGSSAAPTTAATP